MFYNETPMKGHHRVHSDVQRRQSRYHVRRPSHHQQYLADHGAECLRND